MDHYQNIVKDALTSDISKLCSQIQFFSEKYHLGESVISDSVYDKLIEILEKRDPKNKLLSSIGYKGSEDKIKLPVFMGSMDKTKDINTVKLWIKRLKIEVKDNLCISTKLDGISCLIVIKDTVKIYTRGDGVYGRDISFLKNYIKLPKNNKPMIVRGELVISKDNYSKNNELYSSPRNMVNGLVNTKNFEDVSKLLGLIDFVLFEVIEPILLPSEQFKFGNDEGFDVVNNKIVLTHNIIDWHSKDKNYLLETLNYYRKIDKYDMDGIIITHNKIYPRLNKNPKHSVAFKANAEGVVTTVKDIIWSVSKYNTIIPRVYFDKIDLGSQVEYCTGFSGKYIFDNCLGPGSKIKVVLSGDVIPYIQDILESTYPKMPNMNYSWNSSKIHCISLDTSKETKIKRMVHFVKTLNIDCLSEGLITKLYDNNYDTIDKILLITVDNMLCIDGFKEVLSKKIYNNIHAVIDNPIELSKLMVASLYFGSGFGEKRISKILKMYPDIMNRNLVVDDISKIEGFHIKTSKQFVDNLKNFKYFMETMPFLSYTNTIQTKLNKTKNSYISGKNIVLTGFRDSNIINYIENNDGIIQSTVNKKTDIVVIKNENFRSSKIEIAKSMNIPIVTKDDFIKTLDI